MSKINILKINICNTRFEKLLKEIEDSIHNNLKISILYLNAYGVNLTRNNIQLLTSLNSADIVHIDGIGIWLALKFLFKIRIPRFNWTDYAYKFLSICERNQWTIFFLGSTDKTLEKARNNLFSQFPNLILAGTMNGYSDLSDSKVIDKINKVSPQILWVGFGTPKQEIWIQENKDKLNCRVIQSVGDVFSLFARERIRGPEYLQKLGFEWLFRLIQNPGRFWRRYLLGIPIFIFLVLCEKIKLILRIKSSKISQ